MALSFMAREALAIQGGFVRWNRPSQWWRVQRAPQNHREFRVPCYCSRPALGPDVFCRTAILLPVRLESTGRKRPDGRRVGRWSITLHVGQCEECLTIYYTRPRAREDEPPRCFRGRP